MVDSNESQPLEQRLQYLENIQRLMTRRLKPLFEMNPNMYTSDFYVIGAVNRTLALIRGFVLMIRERNFVCAAPLVRLQLDTGLRTFALSLVSDPTELAKQLLEGKPLSSLKDSAGKKLRDAYLLDKLEPSLEWVKVLYRETSGFVHLSERHWFTTIVNTDDDTRTAHFQMSGHDGDRKETDYFEVVGAFRAATEFAESELLSYFEGRALLRSKAQTK